MCSRVWSLGSIPAGAGEPLNQAGHAAVVGVYPRGCGGAAYSLPVVPPFVGLSPRVRGSLSAISGPS